MSDIRSILGLLSFSLLLTCGPAAPGQADEREHLFESKIRPVLVGTCFRCHGDSRQSSGLRVDSRDALLTGGDSGPAIVPGQPGESRLIRALRRDEGVAAMPPGATQKLRADQVADFVAWIQAGAVWPENSKPFESTGHWAYQPLRDAPAPEIRDAAWPLSSIDPYILARQEAAGFHPAPPRRPADAAAPGDV